jgi:DNA ligase-1
MTFKPMLAASSDGSITSSVLVSPKLDGIRCVIRDGQALSRSLKPIANRSLRDILSNPLLDGLDGELLAGSATSETAFNSTTRSVMSFEGDSNAVQFHVFDDFTDPTKPFTQRLRSAAERVTEAQRLGLPIQLVEHRPVESESQLVEAYQAYLAQGFEGAMVRDPIGPYKHGRSTAREGFLLKMKPWRDSEAMVLGFDELERNQNEAKTNLLGRTERSTSKEGKVAGGTLGALHVRDIHTGQEFSIGGGFTAADRDLLWAQNQRLVGRIVKYKSVIIGVIESPRFPVFLGFRDVADMEAA